METQKQEEQAAMYPLNTVDKSEYAYLKSLQAHNNHPDRHVQHALYILLDVASDVMMRDNVGKRRRLKDSSTYDTR